MIRPIRIVVVISGFAALFTFAGAANVLAAEDGQVAFNTHAERVTRPRKGTIDSVHPFIRSLARERGRRQATAIIRRASPAPNTWDEANLDKFIETSGPGCLEQQHEAL